MTHELSLMNDLLRKIKIVADAQGTQKIVGVRLKLGALAHISADHLREHFEEAARGTMAQGAQLEIIVSTDETEPHAQDILLESVEIS